MLFEESEATVTKDGVIILRAKRVADVYRYMEPNKGCAPAAKSAVPKTEDNSCRKTETPLRNEKKVTRNNVSELNVEMVEPLSLPWGEMRTKPADFRAEE